jgi:hypothetical protein
MDAEAMDSLNRERRLRLSLRGDAFRQGDVPVTIVAGKLQALQNLLFHAAAAVSPGWTARRGPWKNRYRDVAELSFIAAHHSDLVIDVEMPTEASGPVRDGDTGQKAVDLVFTLGHALQEGPSALNGLTLRSDDRAYLLHALEGLLPRAMDDYQVELEILSPARHRKLTLTGETRQTVRRMLQQETVPVTAEEATLVGELVKIHVGVGPEKITVRQRGVEVDCFYPDWLRDEVANLVAGSIVEVTGLATLDNQENVVRLDTVFDVETVSMEPLRLTRFEHAGVRYNLRRPIPVAVEYADGLWVYHHEALNLWGYGERREDALRDLHENFAYLWKEFAEEDDEILDEKAKALKRALIGARADQRNGARE